MRSLAKAPYTGFPNMTDSPAFGLQVSIAQTSLSSVTPAEKVICSASISRAGLKCVFTCFAMAVRSRTVPVKPSPYEQQNSVNWL